MNENIELGIVIYKNEINAKRNDGFISLYLTKNLFNYSYENDDIFDAIKINKEYTILLSQLDNNSSEIETKRLKRSYISQPICVFKRDAIFLENQWNFKNIYNEYFCFCRGFNCLRFVSKECKYFFYLYLIDLNSKIYQKTDFLLIDFIFKKYSADDVYPLFEEMINQNLSAHYFTEKEDIYEKYCHNEFHCNLIVHVDEKTYKINDEFLERHLTLLLKLRQVLTAHRFDISFINNIFYIIDYITYIRIGHGVTFFKYYLLRDYVGAQNFDKFVIPNSTKLLSFPLKYGWKDENIIKMNPPRWSKYLNSINSLNHFRRIKSNSIFIMFTWRATKKHKKVSNDYINNILNLLNNKLLINHLLDNNLVLYFSVHQQIRKYQEKFKSVKHAKLIEEKDIAECLSTTNLLVSDFSSIIFDIIFRKKPYIIYIPDAHDKNIKNVYTQNYYNVINKFITNDYQFENVYFDINETVNKIIYYIDNGFKLDRNLSKFYDEFNFPNQTLKDFIDYLLKL